MSRPYYLHDENGVLIEKFKNRAAAAAHLGVTVDDLCAYVNRWTGGFFFSTTPKPYIERYCRVMPPREEVSE